MHAMIEPYNSRYLTPTKDFRRLSVLRCIYGTPKASQHRIAKQTNLSSSMVNNYIKSLAREGLITVNGATNRTIRYHLTSSGQSELRKSLIDYSAEIVCAALRGCQTRNRPNSDQVIAGRNSDSGVVWRRRNRGGCLCCRQRNGAGRYRHCRQRPDQTRQTLQWITRTANRAAADHQTGCHSDHILRTARGDLRACLATCRRGRLRQEAF